MITMRIWRNVFTIALAAVALAPSGFTDASGLAAKNRYVTVGAECTRQLASDTLLPTVHVTIENESGLPLSIAFLKSFGRPPGAESGLNGLKMSDPGESTIPAVADGDTVTVDAEWGGGELTRADIVSVLAVTSAGNFVADCDAEEPQTFTYEGSTPIIEGEEATESATIAALAIGQLESWRAYPALYSLMHSDARAKISFEQITCWYAERYGPPVTDQVQTIYSTDVSKVDFAAWTWKVTGTEFKDSAEITYSQVSGIFPEQGDPVEGVMHLVREDGLWRWFFGSSAEGVAALAASCELPPTT